MENLTKWYIAPCSPLHVIIRRGYSFKSLDYGLYQWLIKTFTLWSMSIPTSITFNSELYELFSAAYFRKGKSMDATEYLYTLQFLFQWFFLLIYTQIVLLSYKNVLQSTVLTRAMNHGYCKHPMVGRMLSCATMQTSFLHVLSMSNVRLTCVVHVFHKQSIYASLRGTTSPLIFIARFPLTSDVLRSPQATWNCSSIKGRAGHTNFIASRPFG